MISVARMVPLSLLVVFALGCGGRANPYPASVSGKVTIKGKDGKVQPVAGGTIRFFTQGKAGGMYEATIQEDGTYSKADLPTGEFKVTIDTDALKQGGKMPVYGGGQGGKGTGKKVSPMPEGYNTGPAGKYVAIPARYRNQETSGLSVTLGSGSNSGKDFQLSW
jgi:hypothetical protein